VDRLHFAPYASPENVVRVLDKVRANGLKGDIDEHFLLQLAIGEGMIARTLRAFEFLGFIEKGGSPTERLKAYIVSDDDEAKSILGTALLSAYDLIFRAVSPADDRAKVFNAFRMMKPQGQWDRMVTLFLHLCREAGMEVKDPPPNRGGKGEILRREPRAKLRTFLPAAAKSVVPALPPAPLRPPMDPALVALSDKLRDIRTTEEFDEWVMAYRPLLAFVSRLKTA
jgi:hypothetical protein